MYLKMKHKPVSRPKKKFVQEKIYIEHQNINLKNTLTTKSQLLSTTDLNQ